MCDKKKRNFMRVILTCVDKSMELSKYQAVYLLQIFPGAS